MKRFIVVLNVFLLVLTGCTPSGSGEQDTFVVGMECGYAPYNWTQSQASEGAVPLEGGQYCDGYDVQIARLIAEELGLELEVKKIRWEGLILSLQLGEIDAIIAGMSPTDERKKEIAFSDVYYTEEVGFGIVVAKNGAFAQAASVSDFENARITAQVGTFHVDLIEQLIGIDQAEFMLDFPSMTIALQAGELDGFVADSGTGRSINETQADLLYIQLDGANGFVIEDYMTGVAVGINQENETLVQRVNDAIATISVEVQGELMDNAVANSPRE